MGNQVLNHPGFKGVGSQMRRYVDLYAGDVEPLKNLSIDGIFRYVENLPYVDDETVTRLEGLGIVDEEIICRPARFTELPGLDCKKKSILIGCWAKLNKIPFRFLAVNDTNFLGELGITHVLCQILINGEWVSMDATLPGLFYPGGPMPLVRYAEEI